MIESAQADVQSSVGSSLSTRTVINGSQLFKGQTFLKDGQVIRQGYGRLIIYQCTQSISSGSKYHVLWQYDGEWHSDKMDGQGTLRYPNGSEYTGQFRNGSIEGEGKLVFANGSHFTGLFSGGLPDGQGTFVDSRGQFWKGMFFRGRVRGNARRSQEWFDCFDYVRSQELDAIIKRDTHTSDSLASRSGIRFPISCISLNQITTPQRFVSVLDEARRVHNAVPVVIFDGSIDEKCTPITALVGSSRGIPELANQPTGVVHMRNLILTRRRLQDWRGILRSNIEHSIAQNLPFVLVFEDPITNQPSSVSDKPLLEDLNTFPEDWSVLGLTGPWFPPMVFDPRAFHGNGLIDRYLSTESTAKNLSNGFPEELVDLLASLEIVPPPVEAQESVQMKKEADTKGKKDKDANAKKDKLAPVEKPQVEVRKRTAELKMLSELKMSIVIENRWGAALRSEQDIHHLAEILERKFAQVLPLQRCCVVVVSDDQACNENN